jgi:ubiquinone/menaquinone biosynthesis C-methylase UbiE
MIQHLKTEEDNISNPPANADGTHIAPKYSAGAPWWQLALRLITQGLRSQNYLGQPLLPALLAYAPERYRRALALRILAISPHYYIYQWSDLYPRTMSRSEILEAEHARNVASRKQIGDAILSRYIAPDMTVLDFGCGPGFVARQAARFAKNVVAVDVSAGALACARVLNSVPNLKYVKTNHKDLAVIASESVDAAITFAVLQHLNDEQVAHFLKEFHRVIKPGGKAICHVAVDPPKEPRSDSECRSYVSRLGRSQVVRHRLTAFMAHRSIESMTASIEAAGFHMTEVARVSDIADIRDDVGKQHLFVFRKP